MEQLITLEILFFSSLGSIVSFMYGAIVGSFLNVVILRLPTGERSLVFPPSRCPQCETHIRWYDNIPILSFFCLLGKCRYCKTKISFQYPLVELATALLSLALYTKFGLSFEYFFYFLFVGSLLAIIFIDIAHQIIPDIISLPGIVIGFAGSFFCDVVTWQQSGLGILLGGGVLFAIAEGYYFLTKRDGMGGGDIKLLAMIGGFLGWQSLLFVIFTSSLTGSVIGIVAMFSQKKGGQTRIPFGPFLGFSAMVFLFFQTEILIWWYRYQSTGAFF